MINLNTNQALFDLLLLFYYCSLGQQFATIEAITMLSLLLQRFTFELVDPHTEPAYIASLTLPMAKGLPIRCKHRVDKE